MTQRPTFPGVQSVDPGVVPDTPEQLTTAMVGRILRFLLLALPLLAFATMGSLNIGHELQILGLTVAVGVAYMLLQRGRPRLALLLATSALFAIGVLAMVKFGSIRSTGSLGLVGAVVLGSLFLGPRALGVLVLACAASLGLVVYAENSGWLTTPAYAVGYGQWAVYVTVLVAISVNVYVMRALAARMRDRLRNELDHRAQVLAAHRASEARLAKVLEISPSAMAITTLEDGRILQVNAGFERVFGVARDQILGKTSRDLEMWSHQDDRRRYAEALKRSGRVENFEFRARRGDGAVLDVLISGTLLEQDGEQLVVTAVSDITAEVRAREALRQSEERFSRIFRSSPVPMVITDFDQQVVVDANAAAEQLFGVTRAQAIGQPTRAWHADGELYRSQLERLGAEGQVVKEPAVLYAAEGRSVDVLISSMLIEDRGKRFGITTLVDVTAENRARDAQRRTEQLFRRVFEASPAGLVVSDYESREILMANASAFGIFGVRPDDLRSVSAGERWWADDDQAREVRARLSTQSRVGPLEAKLLRQDGSRFDALVSYEVIVEGERRVVLGVVLDVSEATAAREALARSEERFENVFRESPAPTLVFSADEGRILDCNNAYVDLIKRPRAVLLGRTGLELGIWHDPAQRLAAREIQARDGRVRRHRADLVAGDGSVRRCELSWDPIEFNGRTAIIAYVIDITDRLEAELGMQRLTQSLEARVVERTEQLETANRELEAFSYSVSHDLKAPLRAIDGFTRILADDLDGVLTPSRRQSLERVLTNTARMSQLIEDLLALSQVNRTRLAIEAVDVSGLALSVVAELRQGDPDRRASIEVASGILANCDRGMMRIVFENLLGNAWKFTRGRNDARIMVFEETTPDGRPVYVVRDNGAGFDMRYAAKLFAPFQRFHKPSEFEGTGIGLATVKRIIVRHDGRIWAESTPGHGTSIRFTLGAGKRASDSVRPAAPDAA